MKNPPNPDRLKIPAYLRKKDLAVKARKQLFLSALEQKKIDHAASRSDLYRKNKKPLKKTEKSARSSLSPKKDRKALSLFPPPTFVTVQQNIILKPVGEVIDYFPKIQVAIVELQKPLQKGDILQFTTETFLFQQPAESMQINRKEVTTAKKGAVIGLKVMYDVKPKTFVYSPSLKAKM